MGSKNEDRQPPPVTGLLRASAAGRRLLGSGGPDRPQTDGGAGDPGPGTGPEQASPEARAGGAPAGGHPTGSEGPAVVGLHALPVEPEHAAAVHVLRSPALRRRHADRHWQPSTGVVDVAGLLAEARWWSDGERLLARVAAQLYGVAASQPVDLRRLTGSLDRGSVQAVIDALAIRTGLLDPQEAAAGRRWCPGG